MADTSQSGNRGKRIVFTVLALVLLGVLCFYGYRFATSDPTDPDTRVSGWPLVVLIPGSVLALVIRYFFNQFGQARDAALAGSVKPGMSLRKQGWLLIGAVFVVNGFLGGVSAAVPALKHDRATMLGLGMGTLLCLTMGVTLLIMDIIVRKKYRPSKTAIPERRWEA